MTRLRLLHAIHDFLPRHQAGSEVYTLELTRELSKRHDVFVVTAEYDPSTAHGTIRWRSHEGIPVIEIVNNWEFERFEDTYASARLNRQLAHVLDATRPDVLHVHNLLNLSFDLPRLARERGIPSVRRSTITPSCARLAASASTPRNRMCATSSIPIGAAGASWILPFTRSSWQGS